LTERVETDASARALLWPCATFTSDHMTSKLIISCPCLADH